LSSAAAKKQTAESAENAEIFGFTSAPSATSAVNFTPESQTKKLYLQNLGNLWIFP
jgi:hypothetical protein